MAMVEAAMEMVEAVTGWAAVAVTGWEAGETGEAVKLVPLGVKETAASARSRCSPCRNRNRYTRRRDHRRRIDRCSRSTSSRRSCTTYAS